VKGEEIGSTLEDVQQSVLDLKRFSQMIKLIAFAPFLSAESALENQNAVSEGDVTPYLANFLEQNLPKTKKADEKAKVVLGVSDNKIGSTLSESMGIKCQSNDIVLEMMRGIRLHLDRFIKALKPGDIQRAQLGLGHSYSRSKVKFNVHRVDNMIIQAINLLDTMDKDLNTFSMRVREWYGYHFPELVKIVNDNNLYARCCRYIQDKSTLTDDKLQGLIEIVDDETKAKQIIEASRASMGQDISPVDLINVQQFAERVVQLSDYRRNLHDYLVNKMRTCAPNLSALIGELVGARLVAHAGSLTNLAKYPASTVQILGAEKALFRALKTKGNTPKYGLIFHSTFIGRAGPKNKGRISRYLANKCSIAARIDCFSDIPTSKFGEMLRTQVEERLEFYKSGATPRKNAEVMAKALSAVAKETADLEEEEFKAPAKDTSDKKKSKKEKKRKTEADPEELAVAVSEKVAKDKKKKKNKKHSDE